jgi:hypothetical protein
MGVGIVLIFGLLMAAFRDSRTPFAFRFCFRTYRLPPFIILFSLATVLCGIGLFKSYSRGAWIATICGVTYLVWRVGDQWLVVSGRKSWFHQDFILLSAILLSVAVLSFWEFRFTEWRPARRVFSIANINDFSWRNRVTAWEGALQMMVDKPLLGYGWDQAEEVYQKKYRPSQLESGMAIQMNDYFMLGISAGVPALVCLLVYIGLSLRGRSYVACSEAAGFKGEGGGAKEGLGLDRLRRVCRAGVIVLLVGFWFDGGLLKLATGSVFWILFELGKTDAPSSKEQNLLTTKVKSQNEEEVHTSVTPVPLWLKWVAGLVAGLALIQTIVLVGTPFLPVSRATLAIARRWLVPPRAVGDWDLLVAETAALPGMKLRVLLQHASLANYNRQIIDWQLDEEIYREYVLTPTIDRQHDGQLAWRRPLWEFFYPPIRHQNDLQAADEIVMKFLRNRITIVPKGPASIQEMWKQQKADAKGFEALKVAAFRAVGIPARLNEKGEAELFANGKWRPGPE